MECKNSFGYIAENIFWLLLSMYWYRSIFFRSIFNFTVSQSKVFLWALVIIICLLSYLFTNSRNRTGATIFLTLLLPYELYAIFTYSKYFPVLTLILSILSAIVLIIYLFWTWIHPFPRNKNRVAIIRSRIRQSAFYVRSIPAIFLCPFLAVVLITLLRGGTLIVPNIDPTQYKASEESLLLGNLDTICKLNEEQWTELSSQEKIDVLQLIVAIERDSLGIYHEISLQCEISKKDSVLGEYDPINHVIMINIDHLEKDPPQEVLDTIVHECYHAYQWCLAHLFADSDEQYRELYLFTDAKQYVNEFSNYHDDGDSYKDYVSYYYQSVEVNARIYAANAVEHYYSLIDFYGNTYPDA